jgi:MFS transporter, NNP family, nitrate/nitrite transporter
VAAGCLVGTASLPPLNVVLILFFTAVGCLGIGNGAVFQLVPLRFTASLGLVTGIIGAAGGFGGALLPSMLGVTKDATGNYAAGLTGLAILMFAGALVLLQAGTFWASRWRPQSIKQSGVFSYRAVFEKWLP